MRIGIDIRCLMESRYSGISEYTYNLLDRLFKIDSKNQYFLFYNSAKPVEIPEFNYPNVEIKRFKYPNKIFNLLLRFFKITEIDRLIGGVDVFLIPNFLFLNLSPACKKILIVHDLSFDIYPEFFTFKKRLWHQLINPKKLCRDSDKIIAISQNTKNDITEIYNINPDNIEIVNPGIADIFFQPIEATGKNAAKEKYNLPDRFIFYLGNLEPRKNLEALLLAFENIADKNINLVIAGGWAWKYENINELWKNSPVKDRIKFLGYIDAKDRPALYSLAEVFVYPSIYEGFGLPPAEAMACGTPVITSFSSSLPEVVGNAGLLIDPNNYNEIGQAIDQLLGDPALTESLAQKGRQKAKQFNWQQVAEKFLKIFDNLQQH